MYVLWYTFIGVSSKKSYVWFVIVGLLQMSISNVSEVGSTKSLIVVCGSEFCEHTNIVNAAWKEKQQHTYL